MDEFTQSMLDRARQRREALAARLGTDETISIRKRHVEQNDENKDQSCPSAESDDSPTKRQCFKEAVPALSFLSPSKVELLTTPTGSSPRSACPRSRFAALADSINSWEDESSAKKEKRQAPLAPSVNNEVNMKPSAVVAEPPPKPPRLFEVNDDQLENVDPGSKADKPLTVKYQAPLAPEASSVPLLTEASKSTPGSAVSMGDTGPVSVSSVKLVLSNSHQAGSPVKISVTPIKQSTASPAKSAVTTATQSTASPAKLNSNLKAQPTKCTVTQNLAKVISSETCASLDASINEPTKQPVSVRLAAWQSKEIVSNSQEPLPVTSRVKNYEKKVGSVEQHKSSKSTLINKSGLNRSSPSTYEDKSSKFGSQTCDQKSVCQPGAAIARRSPSGRALHNSTVDRRPSSKTTMQTVCGRSPMGKSERSPCGKGQIESPVKGSLSPQKLAPATRAVQERLLLLCESTGKNDAVERERQQRAAEIQALEGRWKSNATKSSDNSSPAPLHEVAVTETIGSVVTPPIAPPLPPSKVASPQATGKRLAHTTASPRGTVNTAGSPGSLSKDPKREAARDRMRTEFESKLKMMGFDVNSSSSSAVIDLKKSSSPASTALGASKTSSILSVATSKAVDDSSSSKSKTAVGSSLYSLIKKQSVTSASPACKERILNGAVQDCNDSEDDSFDTNDDDQDDVDQGASGVRVKRQPTVTFANPVVEREPSEHLRNQTPSVSDEQMMDSISTQEDDQDAEESDEDSGRGVESEECVRSEDDDDDDDDGGDGEDDEDDDDDDDQEGEVNDLLDEALTDAAPACDKKEAVTSPLPPESTVVMRKKSVKRLSSGPHGFISLQDYRRQTRPVSQTPTSGNRSTITYSVIKRDMDSASSAVTCATSANSPGARRNGKPGRPAAYNGDKRQNVPSPRKNQTNLMSVMRQSDVSRHEEDDLLPHLPDKSVKQRLQELQDLVNQELNVIQQTSNALNQCCHRNSAFAGSAEAVECHRLLLCACKKREAYMIEMQKLRERPSVTNAGAHGRLTISDIKLPLKSEFMSRIGSFQDSSVFYFIVMIRHGFHIIFTQMVSTHDVMVRGSLDFPNLINLSNITQDFVVDIEIYGMSVTRTLETQTPKKKSKVASCTPKKLLTPKASKFQNPAGPYAVRTSNFVHVASLQLTKAQLMKSHFALDRIPYSFPLQGSIQMRLNCLMESTIEERGFLTMFEDVSGFGAWHRRWCVLRNNVISFWKYPDDEKEKEPIGIIELKRCITDEIGLVSRDVCARPNTFELKTVRRQQHGEKETLVTTCYDTTSITKHWLSADTKEERLLWTDRLNEALSNVRAWHADALRPQPGTPVGSSHV